VHHKERLFKVSVLRNGAHPYILRRVFLSNIMVNCCGDVVSNHSFPGYRKRNQNYRVASRGRQKSYTNQVLPPDVMRRFTLQKQATVRVITGRKYLASAVNAS